MVVVFVLWECYAVDQDLNLKLEPFSSNCHVDRGTVSEAAKANIGTRVMDGQRLGVRRGNYSCIGELLLPIILPKAHMVLSSRTSRVESK
jgi:hypothetical protein